MSLSKIFKLMSEHQRFWKDYGKSQWEKIRNHKDMKVVTSREKYGKYVMKLNFKNGYSFSKEIFAVEIKTEKPRSR